MISDLKYVNVYWRGSLFYKATHCKLRFCSSTIFVQIEQKWLATATEIVVLTKMVAISTVFVHFGQKWLVMSMWSAASPTFVRFGINLDNDKMLHKDTENVLNSQY